METLAWACAFLAVAPLMLGWRNLFIFRAPLRAPPAHTCVSVLIPARDEASQIGAAVAAALRSTGVDVEVVVLDDQSRDDTAGVVERLAAADARVRLVRGTPLPPGWAGKQRACHLLSLQARHGVLFFIDADVRLQPQAVALAAGHLLSDDRLGLVSGFPRELTEGLTERLVIPWIHVLLLGYLPMDRMRRASSPAYAAACGQWIVARRAAYNAVGGHAAAPASLHDGLSLPRTFRAAGWMTDAFDGTTLAQCRMYSGFKAVWRGFGKSAGEGIATPRALPIWTLLILGGHVAPLLFLLLGWVAALPDVAMAGAVGVAANLALRLAVALRFRQSLLSALLHPVGALLVLAINWIALIRHLAGRPSAWRGRSYVRHSGPRSPSGTGHRP